MTAIAEACGSLDSSDFGRILPDRIETGTFLVAAAMAGGEVLCKMTDFHSLEPVIEKLRATNALLEVHTTLRLPCSAGVMAFCCSVKLSCP